MRKIVRITEDELKRIMHKSVVRAMQERALINESIDLDREIKLAQKTLCRFPLSEIGMRLEGTPFHSQFREICDAIIDLNNALIKHIRKEK